MLKYRRNYPDCKIFHRHGKLEKLQHFKSNPENDTSSINKLLVKFGLNHLKHRIIRWENTCFSKEGQNLL